MREALQETRIHEVIEDIDGSTWISHCGWAQGGVAVAPLTFEAQAVG